MAFLIFDMKVKSAYPSLDPEVHKSDSGFKPRDHYLATVGLNPAVYTLCSGFTLRYQHLSSLGLAPVAAILY